MGARWALGRRVRRPEVSCGPRPDVRTRTSSGLRPHTGPSGHTDWLHLVAQRPRAASASGPRVLLLGDARGGPCPGRPGAVSAARAAARCSAASAPEDGPAWPSVLQLRTRVRLPMTPPRGTSCDDTACQQAGWRLPSPVGPRLPASRFIPESLPVSTSHVFRASSGPFVPSQVFHGDRGSSSVPCGRGAHRSGVCLGMPPAGQLSTACACGEWEAGTKSERSFVLQIPGALSLLGTGTASGGFVVACFLSFL